MKTPAAGALLPADRHSSRGLAMQIVPPPAPDGKPRHPDIRDRLLVRLVQNHWPQTGDVVLRLLRPHASAILHAAVSRKGVGQ
jgi:hypothetical protein